MKKLNGFTFIELMIVIAIIGILAALILPICIKHSAVVNFKPEVLPVAEQPVSTIETVNISQNANVVLACVDRELYVQNVNMHKRCTINEGSISVKP